MDGSIVLSSSQRKRLLEIYRDSGGKELHHSQVRLRAHIILVLADRRRATRVETAENPRTFAGSARGRSGGVPG